MTSVNIEAYIYMQLFVCIQAHDNTEAVSYTHTTDTREAAVLAVTLTLPYPQPHSARLVPLR